MQNVALKQEEEGFGVHLQMKFSLQFTYWRLLKSCSYKHLYVQ